MRLYDYIFYKIYKFLKVFDSSPTFAAIIVVSWLFMFNVLTITYYISLIYDITAFLKMYTTVIGGIVTFGGHLFYFYWRGRHIRISDRYKSDKKYSLFGSIGVLLYFILTLLLFFMVVAPKMGGIIE